MCSLKLLVGLESDTVEGVIDDRDYKKGTVDMHFTSAYDKILQRWVPIMISIIFGRTKKHYYRHWKCLLEVYQAAVKENQDIFDLFPGITLDWSDAEGSSLIAALRDLTKNDKKPQVHAWLKKCAVHFKRSLHRVVTNGGVIPRDQQDKFLELVDILVGNKTTFRQFTKACSEIARKFTKATPWLSWYLHLDRAMSFFPACQAFTKDEQKNWKKLPIDTNAQENVGKQFQEANGKKLSINGAIICSWKFANSRAQDRAAKLRGLSTNYAGFKRSLFKESKKRKKRNNPVQDHRPPDTSDALLGRGKRRKQSAENQDLSHLYEGIKWNMPPYAYNTCPLDSFLDGIFVPYFAKLLIHPYPELANSDSLLSRSFALLQQNQHNEARLLWITEFYHIPEPAGLNLWGFTDTFFSSSGVKKRRDEDTTHPFRLSCEMVYQRTRHCIREGGCESDKTIQETAEDDSDDDIILAEDNTRRESRRKRITCIIAGKTILGHLEQLLEEHQLPMCDRQLLDPAHKNGAYRYCTGPNIVGEAQVIKWPHTMVFDVNGVAGRGTTLSDLPFTFEYKTKKFVLRTAIIGGGGHFTAVIRCPDAWMFYDGMNSVPRFRMHPLNQDSYSFMTANKSLNFLLYEVINATITENFGDVNLDLIHTDQTLNIHPHNRNNEEDGNNNSSDDNDNDNKKDDDDNDDDNDDAAFLADDYWENNAGETQESILEGLEKTRKDAQKLHKNSKQKKTTSASEKEKEKSKKTTPRKERIPKGFSVRKKVQTRGPKPICKSCGMQIEYDDICIRHSYKERDHYRYVTVDQYHGRAHCLKKMSRAKLIDFKNKRWTDKTVLDLLQELGE